MAAREPLSRERVLATAVARADRDGIDAVSMRNLAHELDVVPMALYKHVAGKDELLDGMVDAVVSEIAPPGRGGWKHVLRARILSAREAMLRHPWAPGVLETRTTPSPTVLAHMDATIRVLLDGGLSVDLTHHVMHALGSRIFGFSQELYPTPPGVVMPPEVAAQLAAAFPNVVAVATSRPHDPGSVVGPGCDDQFEFEFGLDLVLDGIERRHKQRWTSSPAATSR